MKKSLLLVCSLAAGMAVAMVSACRDIVEVAAVRAIGAVTFVARLVRETFDFITAPARKLVRNLPGPTVQLLVAKVYQLRQVKRDRPVLSDSWRMCPSA